MRIESIHIQEGIFERKIEFSSSNLIHSPKNSCGKTTLLRFILYGLGYNIPNTRNIKFNNCNVSVVINCESIGTVRLNRSDAHSISLIESHTQKTFVLPEQEIVLHGILFNSENNDVTKNLLGAFYVDQEKGWTLLNRGLVIGNIHFSIEELIRGLSKRSCTDLINQENQLIRDRNKYKEMFSVAQYRESIADTSSSLLNNSYDEKTQSKLDTLLIQQSQLKSELKRVDKALSDNRNFKKYVSTMKLVVETPNGDQITVNENNIVGLNDSVDLLIAKRKILASDLAKFSSQISELETTKTSEYEQLEFFHSASQLEIFDKSIIRIPLNQQAIKKEIDSISAKIKIIRETISAKTRNNNSIVGEMSEILIKYLNEFGLNDKGSISGNYLFTSNLKELSGAILHKTAFAFRLAYITTIQKKLNIQLPIILDSPSGKEVDSANTEMMMAILKRDFPTNQIIIASIFTYNLNNLNTIEIDDKLIDSEIPS